MSPVEKDVARSGVLRSLVASARLARRRRGHGFSKPGSRRKSGPDDAPVEELLCRPRSVRTNGRGPSAELMSANREERTRLTYALDEFADGEAHLEEVFGR